MSSFYFSSNTDVSELVRNDTNIISDVSGPYDVPTNSFFKQFPAYYTSDLSFERHVTPLGYQVLGTDLANQVVAYYKEYIGGGSTNSGNNYNNYAKTQSANNQQIPPWCKKLRVVVIGSGGGGGGGGANSGSDPNSNSTSSGVRGGSGGGGGGGGLAAGEIAINTTGQVYDISLGGCGIPGVYQGTSGAAGDSGNDPDLNTTTFRLGTTTLEANCGSPGDGGQGTEGGNTSNTSNGGNGSVNNGSVNATNVLSYYTNTGNGSTAGNNCDPGEGGTVNIPLTIPVFNKNQGDSPSGVSNTNGRAYNQNNELPGIGQGGWGGLNSQNNNGYAGQYGGRSYIRVYFIR